MLKANPARLKNLKESLKLFTAIKKNIYLDRKRKTPKNDDIESCLCRPRGETDTYLPFYVDLHSIQMSHTTVKIAA